MSGIEDLARFVSSRFVSESDVSIDPEEDLLKRGLLDSIAVMHIVEHVEEAYGVELDGADITVENFESLASIWRLIERKRGGAGTG